MDRNNNQAYGGNGFQQQGSPTSPDDPMSGMDMITPTTSQMFSHDGQGDNAQMQNRRDSNSMGLNNSQQHGGDSRNQSMAHFGNPMMGSFNNQQLSQAAAMNYNPMMSNSMFGNQQTNNANLMSQMLINNAANLTYANMLANAQTMQPQMQSQFHGNPQMMQQMPQGYLSNTSGSLDSSSADPQIQAMMRNNPPTMSVAPNTHFPSAMMGSTSQPYQQTGQPMDQRRSSSSVSQGQHVDQRLTDGTMQGPVDGAAPGMQEHNQGARSQSRQNSESNSRRDSAQESQDRSAALRMYSAQQAQHAQSRMPASSISDEKPDVAKQEQAATPIPKKHQLAKHYPPSVKIDQGNFKDAYSSTGFDMLSVLMRVATRKNPEIDIGAVDLSCAFVVTDVQQHDIPIVYVSENFERLTGYTKHEILGQNCRFLQSPDGHVQGGLKRKYVDDDTVFHLKNTINAMKEVQVSVINYRKGGQPFMNLLTVIPVCFEDSMEYQFYVGFQVDLVEQPHSVTNKNPDGTYSINYQRGLTMPRYIFTGKGSNVPIPNTGQTISREEVSTVLSTIDSGNSQLSQRVWDKVLLENSDDVIFVLSLKGLFLYLSPASSKVLEYSGDELTGTSLSSVCHPSDIVPVTRELKDATNDTTVTVVFRIRRKTNGYMWFEGHGSIYTEQGKGRKSIVLVGRERPVYTLKKRDITANGGFGENEIWTKLSTSGMFLYVSSSIRTLLDKHPTDLIGTSIQTLMRPDSRAEFGRILELARSGRRASTRHEILNKRGQVLQAVSTVHPGDATEGSKPTFIIGQTRLLKYTRPSTSSATTPNKPAITPDTPEALPPAPDSTSVSTSPGPNKPDFDNLSTHAGQDSLPLGDQSASLAHSLNLFTELKTTRSTSWQFELRQMEKRNRLLAEELQNLLAARKKRKRRKGAGAAEKECSNCRTKATPEWRRGPSGNRDLCNSCGLRWAKQQGRISPRTNSHRGTKSSHSDGTNVSGGRQGIGSGGGTNPSAAQSAASDAMSVDEPSGGVGRGAKERAATATAAAAAATRDEMMEDQQQQQQVTKAAKTEPNVGFTTGSVTTKTEPTP